MHHVTDWTAAYPPPSDQLAVLPRSDHGKDHVQRMTHCYTFLPPCLALVLRVRRSQAVEIRFRVTILD